MYITIRQSIIKIRRRLSNHNLNGSFKRRLKHERSFISFLGFKTTNFDPNFPPLPYISVLVTEQKLVNQSDMNS